MRNGGLAELWSWVRGNGLRSLVIVVGSLVLIRLLRGVSDRLARLVVDDDPTGVSEKAKRARTLAGILKATGTVTVVLIGSMMVLREVGLDITPIIAGAGVVGLAIGFGAQGLIKDLIAGFFILLEDQFHVGDIIQVSGVSGLVERMNLRITVVRDLHGTVHFVPNGEIRVVSNLTKEWSRAVVEVGVGYGEDVDRVIGVLNSVGRDLAADPALGPVILEGPQVLGVEALGESQVTLRVLVKTLPLKQFDVARELRKRIKAAFDREGIEIPFPTRIIVTRHEDRPGTPRHEG